MLAFFYRRNIITQPTITKNDIANLVSGKFGLNQLEAKEFLDQVLEEIKNSIATDGVVKVAGFASFEVKQKHQRPGRNLSTGETVPVSARRVIRFRPSRHLSEKATKRLHDSID